MIDHHMGNERIVVDYVGVRFFVFFDVILHKFYFSLP